MLMNANDFECLHTLQLSQVVFFFCFKAGMNLCCVELEKKKLSSLFAKMFAINLGEC